MRQNQTTAQLSIPARISVVALLAGLGAAYFILSNSVARNAEDVLSREWAASHSALACLVRDRLAEAVSRGQELGVAFEQGDYREALKHAGPYSGMLLVAPDLSAALWSRTGAVPEVADFTGYLAVDTATGRRSGLAEHLAEARLDPYRLATPAGDRLPFDVVSTGLGANGWTVMLFRDRRAARELVSQIGLSQTLAFLALALLLLLLLLAFYISLASALAAAVRSAAALGEAGRRFEERAGSLRGPLTKIQGLADMLVITEDPDERANYLSEIKDEIRKLAAELQAYQGMFGP